MRSLIALCVCLAACSGDSCSCEQYEARPFPSGKLNVTIPAAGQVRVTASGINYVESQVPYLINQVLPDGLSFCIPRDTSGNPDLCIDSTCSNGAPGCQVDLTLADHSITPQSPDRIAIDVTIGSVDERLNFDYDAGLFTANCYVQLFKGGSSESTPATVSGTVPIRIFADQASPLKEVGIEIGDVAVDLSDVDFKIHSRGNFGDVLACEGASLVRGLFRGIIEREIGNALAGAVQSVQDAQLCQQCSGAADCPSNASCTAGVCRYAASCVPQTLGIEGRLTLSVPELESVTRESNPRADFLGKAADLAQVNTGITVGLRGGAEPVNVSDCVPVDLDSRPVIQPISPTPAITGDTRPGGKAFMFGVGVHRSALEQALWTVWASGATCLTISGEEVTALSTTTFVAVAPSVRDLAGLGKPITLAIVANRAPNVVLGANTVTPSGDTYTIDDPLLLLDWEDVDLHLFTQVEERNVRLFTLRLHLQLPIAVAYDGTSLVPLIGDIESAIASIEATRTEIMAETRQKIEDAVPTILSIAAPFLDYGLPDGIELPDFLGFRIALTQEDITSVENGAFIALYANLTRSGAPLTAVANTAITATEVRYDRVLPSGFVRPEVHVDVRGFSTSPLESSADYEFSWRVDHGLWSLYTRNTRLVIGDPILSLPGEHLVEVRARRIGDMRTSDPSPAFTVIHTNHDALLQLHSTSSPRFAPIARSLEPAAAPTEPAPSLERGLGCATAPGDAGLLALLLVGGFIVVRRRRRSALAVVATLLVASGCARSCTGTATVAELCDGEPCADLTCIVDSDCAGACPDGGAICEQSRCLCVTACEPSCPVDSFCCTATDECISFANLCANDPNACDPGYEVGVTQAVPDRQTCELTEYTCECRPLPPLSLGWHGGHTAIDSDGTLTVVTTYNKTYGDLMLGVVKPDASIDWHFVDGLPDGGEVTADPNGPRGGKAESGSNVGTHSAVVVASSTRVHVFYRDESAKTLKWGVATLAGDDVEFTSTTVEPTEGAGMWTSAVLVGSQIHVVYTAVLGDSSELRHLIVDADASPTEVSPTTILREETEPTRTTRPAVAGAFMDLTQSGGTPYLVFYNGVSDRVGRTTFDGTAWAEPAYVASGNGPWAAGALTDDGNQHVVFMQSNGLRYSRFGETLTSQVTDGVRALAGEYYKDRIGEDAALRLEAGEVIVAFQDTFDRALIIATSPTAESGSWTQQRLRADGTASGFWIAMTRRGARWVADMVIDRSTEEEAYVRVTAY